MRTHFCLFLSCLFCFALPLVSGYGSENAVPPAEQDRKAGERMVLMIQEVEYAFRWCPAGTFMMGSPASEPGRRDNETQHSVTLSHGFWMLETQVTQAMWESVMRSNPSHFKGAKLPVEMVSWNDCQEYIKKLNELLAGTPVAPAGYQFSLPTEAQWEYACRAGTTTAYHFGDTLTQQQANFDGNQTKEVGSYPANVWGLKDMHGNVWERCADWFGDYPNNAVTDPTGVPNGSLRVIRGGGWGNPAEYCRSALRSYTGQINRGNTLGLRLILSSSPPLLSADEAGFRGADGDGKSPFENIFEAASRGTIQDIAYFVKNGADVNAKDRVGYTPFLLAASSNPNVEVLRYLVSLGADANAKNIVDMTPLALAAAHNPNVAVLEYLVSQGADVHAKNINGNNGGWTPLHSAAGHNPNVAVLEYLVSQGTDVHAKNDGGMTPLHYAAQFNRNVDVLRYLVSKGAKVNVNTNNGDTPLHSAVRGNRNVDVLKYLVSQGADVNAKNNEGKTPLDEANTEEMRVILRAVGAEFRGADGNDKSPDPKLMSFLAQLPQPYRQMGTKVWEAIVQGNETEADRIAQEYIKSAETHGADPNVIHALHYVLGRVFLEASMFDSANRYLSEATKCGGQYVYYLALCKAKSGDVDGGFSLLLDEIDRTPPSDRSRLLIAICQLLIACQHSIQVQPSETMFEKLDGLMNRIETEELVDPMTINALATYLTLRDKSERAIPLCEKGLTLDNLDETHALFFQNKLAMLYSEVLGEHQKALDFVNKALETRMDDIDFLNIKGLILINAGNPTEAIPVLRRAVELANKHSFPRMYLAYALHLEGRDAESRQYFMSVRDDFIPSAHMLRKEDKAIYDALMLAHDVKAESLPLPEPLSRLPQPYNRMGALVWEAIVQENEAEADRFAQACIKLAEIRNEHPNLILTLNSILGKFFLDAAMFDSASRYLSEVAKHGGTYVYPLALCKAKSGDVDGGFTLLLDEIDRMPSVMPKLLPAILVLQAQVPPSEAMFEKIDGLMNRIATEEPVISEAILALTDWWILRGKPERAIPLYEEGLTRDNLDETQAFVFQNNLATLYSLVRGEHQKALDVVNKALETRRDNPTLLNTKGIILINAGDPTEAIPVLRRAVELSHQLPISCMHLAYALHLVGRDAESRQYFVSARDPLTPFVPTMTKENKAMYDALMRAHP